MLTDRFGVFEALAQSTIALNRCTSADELSMDPLVAQAVLEFGDDLRTARAASDAWAESKGLVHSGQPAEGRGARNQTAAGPESAAAVVFTCWTAD